LVLQLREQNPFGLEKKEVPRLVLAYSYFWFMKPKGIFY